MCIRMPWSQHTMAQGEKICSKCRSQFQRLCRATTTRFKLCATFRQSKHLKLLQVPWLLIALVFPKTFLRVKEKGFQNPRVLCMITLKFYRLRSVKLRISSSCVFPENEKRKEKFIGEKSWLCIDCAICWLIDMLKEFKIASKLFWKDAPWNWRTITSRHYSRKLVNIHAKEKFVRSV